MQFSGTPSYLAPEVYQKKAYDEKIVKKPHSTINKRKEIHIVLRETNLEAQLFFKSQKFKAIEVLRHNFEDTQEDGYLMRLALTQKEPQLV